MYQFSERTVDCLDAAGWSQNYWYDTAKLETRLKNEDCILPATVVDFLQHFGDLKVKVPVVRDKPISELQFGEYRLYHICLGEVVCNKRDALGSHDIPVFGVIQHGLSEFLMATDGTTYLWVEGSGIIADYPSIDSALDWICTSSA